MAEENLFSCVVDQYGQLCSGVDMGATPGFSISAAGPRNTEYLRKFWHLSALYIPFSPPLQDRAGHVFY
jgi:hypothetical protein